MSGFNPIETNALHVKAMDLEDQAIAAGKAGNYSVLVSLYSKALQIEKQAAMTLVNELDCEPSRSVLFRSAGALALRCNKYREAEKMAAFGLAGFPPSPIDQELRDVMSEAWDEAGVGD